MTPTKAVLVLTDRVSDGDKASLEFYKQLVQSINSGNPKTLTLHKGQVVLDRNTLVEGTCGDETVYRVAPETQHTVTLIFEYEPNDQENK